MMIITAIAVGHLAGPVSRNNAGDGCDAPTRQSTLKRNQSTLKRNLLFKVSGVSVRRNSRRRVLVVDEQYQLCKLLS